METSFRSKSQNLIQFGNILNGSVTGHFLCYNRKKQNFLAIQKEIQQLNLIRIELYTLPGKT